MPLLASSGASSVISIPPDAPDDRWPPGPIEVAPRIDNRHLSDIVLERLAQPQFWAKPNKHKSMIDPRCAAECMHGSGMR